MNKTATILCISCFALILAGCHMDKLDHVNLDSLFHKVNKSPDSVLHVINSLHIQYNCNDYVSAQCLNEKNGCIKVPMLLFNEMPLSIKLEMPVAKYKSIRNDFRNNVFYDELKESGSLRVRVCQVE